MSHVTIFHSLCILVYQNLPIINQFFDPLCIRMVHGSRLVSLHVEPARSVATAFFSPLSSSGNISAKQTPLSLHTGESLLLRQISSLTKLRMNSTTRGLLWLFSFRPTLRTTSTASSSWRISKLGAIFLKSCMVSARMFSSLFSSKPLSFRHHRILYLSGSLILSFSSSISFLRS